MSKIIPIRPGVRIMAKADVPEKYLFASIPPRALKDARLSASHFRVLGVISYHDRFGRNNTGCYASQKTLAEQTDLQRETVNRNIRQLREWGYVHSKKSPTGKGRMQHFVVHEKAPSKGAQGPLKAPEGVINSSHKGVTDQSHMVAGGCDEFVNTETGEIVSKDSQFKGFGIDDLPGRYSPKEKYISDESNPYPGQNLQKAYSAKEAAPNSANSAAFVGDTSDTSNITSRICQIERAFKRYCLDADWMHSDQPKLLCQELFQITDSYAGELEICGHAERVMTDIEFELDEVA